MTTLADLYHDTLTGVLLARGQQAVLAVGPGAPELGPLATYTLVYAWHLLEDPRLFFPTLVLDDFGTRHTGVRAYTWLDEHSYSQPRADVFGFWADGRADQLFARDLDVETRPRAFATPGATAALNGTPLQLALSVVREPGNRSVTTPTPTGELPGVLTRAVPGYRLNLAALAAPANDLWPLVEGLLKKK